MHVVSFFYAGAHIICIWDIRIIDHLDMNLAINKALPGVLGIQEEGLFFRDLGRRVIYIQGFGEKA